jgi:ATP-dependent DNA helicase RecG
MMNKLELDALISQGEGFHLEFKEGINANLNKEIVAFANAKGGRILIGVADNGTIKNKQLGNDQKSNIQVIARECDPSIDISVESVDGQSNVLVVIVKEGLNKPYRCSTGFYMREGANSNKRTTHEVYEMFREADRFSFDDKLCLKADFEKYFEPTTLKRFFAEAKKEQILSDVDTLHNLGVLEFVDGKPVFNNTGILFFTKEPERFLSQAIIQCARYKGIIKVDFEDQKNMTSDVISNIDDCFTFLRRSLDVAYKFESGKPTRTEVWEIPHVALKEALINSIAHRDYVHRGTHIQVEVFDDRVSITNFGGLPKGLEVEDFGRKSMHRNPNMVNLLHRSNFIEKMGTGIFRINEALEQAGLPKAEFEISEYWFSIIFKRKKTNKSELNLINDFILSNSQKQILLYCLEPKKREEVLNHIGFVNEYNNYKRHILPLLNIGYLQLTIPDKPKSSKQTYVITELGKEYL